jgi:two-component SAPR family response regulator
MRVLVVEDDFFIADDLATILEQHGASVMGPISNSGDALDLLGSHRPDCALLDVNLAGEMAFGLAAALKSSDVPFLFITGYDRQALPEGFADVAILNKPFTGPILIEAIERLLVPPIAINRGPAPSR